MRPSDRKAAAVKLQEILHRQGLRPAIIVQAQVHALLRIVNDCRITAATAVTISSLAWTSFLPPLQAMRRHRMLWATSRLDFSVRLHFGSMASRTRPRAPMRVKATSGTGLYDAKACMPQLHLRAREAACVSAPTPRHNICVFKV